MDRYLVGKKPHFRPVKKRSNFYRSMLYLSLILSLVWVYLGIQRGAIKPAFQATPTPTRMPASYLLEAQAYFNSGKLDDPSNNITPQPLQPGALLPTPTPTDPDGTPVTPTPIPAVNDAIEAYRAALEIEPENLEAWIELARIQAYSSRMLPNDTTRLARLEEAVATARQAVALDDESSMAHAVLAFVLDWYAFNPLVPERDREAALAEANSEAVRAYQLDKDNALALSYYAEILADQQKWAQALQYAEQAMQLSQRNGVRLMDTHRVLGYVNETIGYYAEAINQYRQAAEIAPNLTFLYVLIGQNYREGIKNPDLALEYFDRAARINEQLGVQNPIPYIEIAKTYTQEGQFFAAAVNAEKALSLDNRNPSTYGQLGQIFIRARNYEGAVPLLQCAVRGCTAEENEMGQVDVEGLPLSNLTVAYYYVEYGTVLAFLSKPSYNNCPLAMEVLAEVRARYPEDPVLMSIVEDSEGICRNLEAQISGRPTPTRESTPVPTDTPSP